MERRSAVSLIVGLSMVPTVLTIATPARARAQQLERGALVRVSIMGDDAAHEGRLVRMSADSLVVTETRGDTVGWARARVARLQMRTKGSHVPGMTIGIIVGAGVGAVLGASSSQDNSQSLSSMGQSLGEDMANALAFGLLGGAVGGFLGYQVTRHAWRDVQIAPTVGARNGAVRIALRF